MARDGAEKASYRDTLEKAIGSDHNDDWPNRTVPNAGVRPTPEMLAVTAEFAEDSARNMNERYGSEQ
jgi:type V secretory pathway adhesin AidA